MKKFIFSLILTIIILAFSITVLAEGNLADFESTDLSAKGFDYPKYINDQKYTTYADNEGLVESEITLTNNNGIAHLYIEFTKIYGEFTITDNNTEKSVTVGQNSFLHEYINVKDIFAGTPKSLTLKFERNAYVAEVYGFTDGTLPDWVQIWEKPLEKADILLLSSHSDDEQLFFGGILPYYAGERKVDVQVVYLISHFDTNERPHEQLNGLWAVGVRNYPVISDFPDLYSESLDDAIAVFEKEGVTYDDFTEYIVENIRRFKPQVLITHDIAGEYGHGTHIYCTDVVINSLPKISDKYFCPESAEKYGTWEVPKTYFHLYENNTITMNWDSPLESFEGKTAFEMTVIGFSYHKSQHWTWFNDWIHGKDGAPVTKATDIKDYSPCLYGLYSTSVGPDTVGGDFLENITPYKEQTPPETEPPESEAPKPVDTTANVDTTDAPDDNANVTQEPHSTSMLLLILIGATVVIIFIFYFALMVRKKK